MKGKSALVPVKLPIAIRQKCVAAGQGMKRVYKRYSLIIDGNNTGLQNILSNITTFLKSNAFDTDCNTLEDLFRFRYLSLNLLMELIDAIFQRIYVWTRLWSRPACRKVHFVTG